MPLVRGEHYFDDHFTQIPNAWLRDNSISFKARGLLAQILSNNPGFELSIRSLARMNKEGRDAIRSAIKELEIAGYLVRVEGERYREEIWETRDPRRSENPTTPVGKSDHPRADNPTTKNTNKNKKENTRDLFETFWKEYPRKDDRGSAERAFKSALNRAKFEDILAGAIRYREDPSREDQFTKLGGTWLRADAWENHYEPSRDSVARIRREKERAQAEEFRRVQEELAAHAVAPPKCKHGKALPLCLSCSKEVS